jgi:hypothetical protein
MKIKVKESLFFEKKVYVPSDKLSGKCFRQKK